MTPSPYQLKFETLRLSGQDYRIRSLLDRQQFWDPDGAAERVGISSATWPLFGLVWPSARILVGVLEGMDLAGKRILEIGCGLGLASLVLQRRGADITASDAHPLAAAFLTENLLLNQLAPIPFRTGNWADADAGLGRFDLIVGSDVLYERDQPGQLSGFIHRHSQAQVEVIIIDPNRGNRACFTRAMDELGYTHGHRSAPAFLDSGEAYKGNVLSYWRGPPM